LELPFANGTFDAVVLADVLYHIDDDETALRECQRALKAEGCVVVNVPAHRWLWSYHDVAVDGRRRYRRCEVQAKLLNAGFCRPYATHWNTLLLPLIFARRKLLPPTKGGSDVQSYSPALEVIGRTALAAERVFLGRGGRFPLGSSILATGHVARRTVLA
jgi:SAM-dependent methyltransferase